MSRHDRPSVAPASRRSLDRRHALGLAGAGALGSALLRVAANRAPPPRVHGQVPERCTQPHALEPLESAVGLQAAAQRLLLQAIEQAPEMLGQRQELARRWDELRALWRRAIELRPAIPLQLQLSGEPASPGGTVLALEPTPVEELPELEQFWQDERNLLEAWAPGVAPGLDGLSDGDQALARRAMAKLLAAAGLKQSAQAILAILDEAGYLWLIGQAIAARDGRLLLEALEELLDFMLGRRFFARLVSAVGERQARSLVGRIAGRFLPYVGWTLFLGQLLWAFAEQVDLSWIGDWLDAPAA